MRLFAIAACILGCSAPQSAPPAVPAPAGWSSYVDPAGLFELSLPEGAVLTRDPGVADDHLYWSPAPGSTFDVLRRAAPDDLAQHLLDGDRRHGEVRIEIDATVDWRGVPAHRVRARVARRAPRTWEEDPATGRRHHRSERDAAQIVDFVVFRGATTSLRVGYRLDAAAPPELASTLRTALESLTLRAPPP